ncbi:LPS translocon maturation chaperone LptM [Pseudoxanthomonas sp. 10H]|uniref:LPS translocon maturation chaperone LptM n=1 Tax=Pseudoxanthomonas sp. 10H TaxID=3242729 RepID=UPI003556A72C
MKTTTLLAASVSVLLLAACGNKGPLVMPQKPVPVEEPAPAAPADPAEPAEPADTGTPPEPATAPADATDG